MHGKSPHQGRNVLHIACEQGSAAAVKCLTECGFATNELDEAARSAMHISAARGDLYSLKYLIIAGADRNLCTEQGTPLHCAAEHRQLDAVQYLVNRGVEVNVRDRLGITPLFRAARSGSLECVRCLLTHGADATARCNAGGTALSVAKASRHGEVERVLATLPTTRIACERHVESPPSSRKRRVQLGTSGSTFRESLHYDPNDPTTRSWMRAEDNMSSSSGGTSLPSQPGRCSPTRLIVAGSFEEIAEGAMIVGHSPSGKGVLGCRNSYSPFGWGGGESESFNSSRQGYSRSPAGGNCSTAESNVAVCSGGG